MAIKAGAPYKHTFVITHCNGRAGYLPPKHVYDKGGGGVDFVFGKEYEQGEHLYGNLPVGRHTRTREMKREETARLSGRDKCLHSRITGERWFSGGFHSGNRAFVSKHCSARIGLVLPGVLILCGAAPATSGLAVESTATQIRSTPAAEDVPPPSMPEESDTVRGPRVVVKQEDYDFGKMETDNAGQHEFKLSNAGNQPLILRQGRGSCGCCTCVCETVLPKGGKILPGDSAAVTLKWTIKRFTGKYYQSSTILTNDPSRPKVMLGVSGRIVPAVRVAPGHVIFSNPLVGQQATGEVRVYGYRSAPLKITDCALSNPSTAQYFETALVPLSADDVAQQQDAQSGVLLRVTLKPGLPLGAFRQGVVLNTNLDSHTKVEIPIQGRIINYISVAGPGWDSRAGVLKLPSANREGARRSLLLLARGPLCEQTKFKLERIVPEYVKAELGETRAVNDGELTRTSLDIRIPVGSPPGNYLGPPQGEYGQIVIDTNHPQQPQLRLMMSFAVEE